MNWKLSDDRVKEKKRYRVKEIQRHRETERGRDARERRGKETTEIQREIERQGQTDRQTGKVFCLGLLAWTFCGSTPFSSTSLILSNSRFVNCVLLVEWEEKGCCPIQMLQTPQRGSCHYFLRSLFLRQSGDVSMSVTSLPITKYVPAFTNASKRSFLSKSWARTQLIWAVTSESATSDDKPTYHVNAQATIEQRTVIHYLR